MFKKILMWIFFSLIAGLLPLCIKWIICDVLNVQLELSNVCSEIFFFNLILSANGIKEVSVINTTKHKKLLLLLSTTLIFILIILSIFYGILVLNSVKSIGLNLDHINFYSIILSVFCLLVNLSIQIFGGEQAYE